MLLQIQQCQRLYQRAVSIPVFRCCYQINPNQENANKLNDSHGSMLVFKKKK